MPLTLSIVLLCLPPIVFCIATGIALKVVSGLRRSFGARRSLTPHAMLAGVVVLVLHGGFFLAPLLLYQGRTTIALLLMTPISLLASLAIIALFIRLSESRAVSGRIGTIAFVLLSAYLFPVLVLATNLM
jgi:hypothetical protein